MKKVFLFSLSIIPATILTAQVKKIPVKKTTIQAASPLKTLKDSASYAIGVSVCNFYKQQGVTSINSAMVSRAINDNLGGGKPLFDDQVANVVMNKYLSRLQEGKVQPNINAGEAYLAKNKLRPEVKTTASGLQYEVVTEGTGIKPTGNDSVTCNYMGTLVNGVEFDNSFKRGAPITFALHGVIAGWTEGLQLMTEGSKYKFYVPYQLGYGAFDYGSIPGGSALLFEVELLKVKK